MADGEDVWTQAADAMLSPYGSVELRCDEYRVNLQMERASAKRANYEIVIYVNGHMKGAWMMNDCEERRRFFRPITRRVYTGKDLAAYKRLKKLGGAQDVDLNRTHTSYMPFWPTFEPLRRHLLKHNKDVRVVKINGQDVGAGPLPQAGDGVTAGGLA